MEVAKILYSHKGWKWEERMRYETLCGESTYGDMMGGGKWMRSFQVPWLIGREAYPYRQNRVLLWEQGKD
jgi:hypothetical protein